MASGAMSSRSSGCFTRAGGAGIFARSGSLSFTTSRWVCFIPATCCSVPILRFRSEAALPTCSGARATCSSSCLISELARNFLNRSAGREQSKKVRRSLHHHVEPVVRHDRLTLGIAECRFLRSALPQAGPSRSQESRLTRWHHLAELSYDAACVADISRCDRNAASHRLSDHLGKAFTEG